MAVCPKCSYPLPVKAATFCPRCGQALGSPIAPNAVHIEKRGTLWNISFIASLIVTIAGGLLAGRGVLIPGVILLAIGVPALLIATVHSLSRRS